MAVGGQICPPEVSEILHCPFPKAAAAPQVLQMSAGIGPLTVPETWIFCCRPVVRHFQTRDVVTMSAAACRRKDSFVAEGLKPEVAAWDFLQQNLGQSPVNTVAKICAYISAWEAPAFLSGLCGRCLKDFLFLPCKTLSDAGRL